MTTPLLGIDPVSDGYSFTPANEVIEVKLDGGVSRRRKDLINSTHVVNAQWILDQGQYTQLMGFFRENVKRGSTPFRMNLVSDANVSMPHVCNTLGGVPKLTQQRGNAFWVSCTVEVTPNPICAFTLFLQNVTVAQFVNAGNSFYTGDLSDFPVGRQVLLTGTTGVASGVTLNLDGTYTIATAPNAFTRTLGASAPAINPQWTTLAGTGAQSYFPGFGAAILIPL